jgi:hypothetical protein
MLFRLKMFLCIIFSPSQNLSHNRNVLKDTLKTEIHHGSNAGYKHEIFQQRCCILHGRRVKLWRTILAIHMPKKRFLSKQQHLKKTFKSETLAVIGLKRIQTALLKWQFFRKSKRSDEMKEFTKMKKDASAQNSVHECTIFCAFD